MLSVATENV